MGASSIVRHTAPFGTQCGTQAIHYDGCMPDSLSEQPGCLGFLQKLFGSPGGGKARAEWPYVRQPKGLLSKAEFSFFRVLQQACGDRYVVLIKVGLGDLVTVKAGTENWQSYRNKIDRKHIDFVLCDPQTMHVVAAVELDDQSHNSEKSRQRDEVKNKACEAAGLPLIRFKAQRSYDPKVIVAELGKL